jgi:hypothetical protein
VLRLLASTAVLTAALAGCTREAILPDARFDGGGGDDDSFPYPPPRTDVVPAIGSAATLEVAAWNIENFPAGASTPSAVADLITSLDLDIVVVEEIADDAAWLELTKRLRDRDAVLSTHVYNATEYQKIGLIVRKGMVAVGPMTLLFSGETYPFPRPALSIAVAIDDHVHPALAIQIIGVHLKAGVSAEDGARRKLAIERLDAHLRAQIDGGGEDEVIIAGDYNEVVTTAAGQANLAALLGAPDRYTLQTQAAATGGEISFIPTRKMIDHITTTAGLAAETAGARVVVPRLDSQYSGYLGSVSDHLPVVLVTPL